MEDDKIIELFYERSEQAITELSDKYGAICNKIADNILNNRQDAEECDHKDQECGKRDLGHELPESVFFGKRRKNRIICI